MAFCLGMGGCKSGGSDLMPLDVGRSWGYMVRSQFYSDVKQISVTREISVANTQGVEMDGSLGASRLAWSGDVLVAERLIGTQFVPPLPLVYKAEETHERPWKGRVIYVDNRSPATASQSQSPDDSLDFNGRKLHCIASTVRLKTASHDIELVTWFSPGIGIVKQEQRTDGTLLASLMLVSLNR